MDPPGIFEQGTLTEQVSDQILKPFVRNQPYVRDTLHLLTLLHDLVVPQQTLLLTLDIEALYSAIPQNKGL